MGRYLSVLAAFRSVMFINKKRLTHGPGCEKATAICTNMYLTSIHKRKTNFAAKVSNIYFSDKQSELTKIHKQFISIPTSLRLIIFVSFALHCDNLRISCDRRCCGEAETDHHESIAESKSSWKLHKRMRKAKLSEATNCSNVLQRLNVNEVTRFLKD